ncbi:hypothetical protein CONPUDRAFT_150879 [Coniophora puteana RWD-64-598 SS2]|uniref:Nuclear transport factor 2 domain-containing protein n=1 Tax=Coniophora puteana (strain RWD-64-598) TaxID=741705 RepID=A0A5M3MXT2_CONPW|nr:uncharacterized protein CONPUDRAFT_150879 [Coniophora puteana RWD-64-598 SS2]EIW83827.1 hypothetical protein CONPUDRAFT_150879 [Coniophora puteana RWD-64-598 SS2]
MQPDGSPTRPLKRELSPTPPPPPRQSACQGTKRFAPFPADCHPPDPNYKRNRQLWAQQKLGEIQRLGLQKEKLFIRDDGVTVDWSSPFPVWTDTLTPAYGVYAVVEPTQNTKEAVSALGGKRLRLEEPRPLTPPASTSPKLTSVIKPPTPAEISPKRKLPVPPRPSAYHQKVGLSSTHSPPHPDARPNPVSGVTVTASTSSPQSSSVVPPVTAVAPPPTAPPVQDQPVATHPPTTPQHTSSSPYNHNAVTVVARSSVDSTRSTSSSRSAASGSLPRSARPSTSPLYRAFSPTAARRSLLPPPVPTNSRAWPPSTSSFSSYGASAKPSQSSFRTPPNGLESIPADIHQRTPIHTLHAPSSERTPERPLNPKEDSDDEIQIIEEPVRPTLDDPTTTSAWKAQSSAGKPPQSTRPTSKPSSVGTIAGLTPIFRPPVEEGRTDASRPSAPRPAVSQASSSSTRAISLTTSGSPLVKRADPRFDFTSISPPQHRAPLSSLTSRPVSTPSDPLPSPSPPTRPVNPPSTSLPAPPSPRRRPSSPQSLPLFLPSPPSHQSSSPTPRIPSHSPVPRELSPSPAEDKLWALTTDYIKRYIHAYDDDRASLALAYAHNATFSYRFVPSPSSASSSSPFYSSGVSSNVRTKPSELRTSRLDIVSVLLGLLPSHRFKLQVPSGAAVPLEYDWRFLGAAGALLVVYANLAPLEEAGRKDGPTVRMVNSFVLRKKDHDREDA